jgi:hypothetical protein
LCEKTGKVRTESTKFSDNMETVAGAEFEKKKHPNYWLR